MKRRSERGAILVMAVPALVLCIAAAALGIDIGRIAIDKRSDQSVADMAALDAARAVGDILNTTNQAGYDSAAQTAAVASAARNGFVVGVNSHTITATVGTVDGTTNAFSAGGASAVLVTTTSHVANSFLPGGKDLTARAVALVGSPIGAFSVGSTLASLDTSKSRLDPMLKTMLGASGSLSLVSYDGLATGNVSLQRLQTALLASGFNVGTVSDLLSAHLTAAQLLAATASALTADGDNTAAAEVQDLINTSITSSTTVTLGDLLNVATPSDSSVLSAEFNAYQLVTGTAQLMNGSNFVSIPLTGVNLLGLAGVSLSAYVIEPAKTAIGPVGTTADDAQVKLRVNLDVPLGGLLPVAHVTLDYTTAQATGTLTSIVCGASPTMGVSGQAAAISVSGTATTLLGNMTISSSVASTSPSTLTFSYPTEFAPTVTKHLGASGAGVSLASVNVTGSGATAALAPVLQLALPTVLSTLDTALTPAIKPLLEGLGVSVGQADIAALGIYPSATSCGGHPRIVQ
ncbi:MAG TPA: hypothetical protein VHD87_17875 [Acidimicrobiales bacterium]|nr:hypothetical protein [Acidimicrobiales bacterium]